MNDHQKKISVLIVDDHHLVRSGIVALLQHQPDIDVIGEASDGFEAVEKVKMLSPRIVLMDISMERMNGIEATREITRLKPSSKVIVLTQYDQEEYIKQVMHSGAAGYLLKSSLADDLLQAIHAVDDGKQFFTPAVSKIIIESYVRQASGDSSAKEPQLTGREKEILQHIAQGLTNQQIAGKLFISVRTVEFHRANIIQKLGIHDVASLVKYAIQKKIIRLDVS